MRALESEIDWTFPAIKKQVDSLHKSDIVDINKDAMKRSITMQKDIGKNLKDLFLTALRRDLNELIQSYEIMIDRYYPGKIFGNEIEADIVIIYKNAEQEQIETIKKEISEIFRSYHIDMISVVFMSASERDKRYRLADRFVLNIMRAMK